MQVFRYHPAGAHAGCPPFIEHSLQLAVEHFLREPARHARSIARSRTRTGRTSSPRQEASGYCSRVEFSRSSHRSRSTASLTAETAPQPRVLHRPARQLQHSHPFIPKPRRSARYLAEVLKCAAQTAAQSRRTAVGREPVDERAERRAFPILDERCAAGHVNRTSLGSDEIRDVPAVDREADRDRPRTNVCDVDERCGLFPRQNFMGLESVPG